MIKSIRDKSNKSAIRPDYTFVMVSQLRCYKSDS